IADKVSSNLKLNLTAEDRERVYRRYTENGAAYNSYLHGRWEMTKNNREGVLVAIQDYKHCLKLDPNYALAQAGLALASAEMHLRHSTPSETKEWADEAMTEAEEAL